MWWDPISFVAEPLMPRDAGWRHWLVFVLALIVAGFVCLRF